MIARWLLLCAVALGVAIACSSGSEVQYSRWGYDPTQPTGEEDPPVPERTLPADYRVEQVLTGLDRPTQLVVTPDGRFLIAEQSGAVRVVEDGRLLEEPFVTVDAYVPELDKIVELGLTGIAVDPAFEENGYVYLYYSLDEPRRTVISRMRDQAGTAGPLEEILSWEEAPECCHIGGGMRFGPEGMLFVGMGDHERSSRAQDPRYPTGSILRINPDGSAPPDNPLIADPEADPRVYAYGLRNAYDIAIDPATERIFAGENGFYGQDAIILVEPGANYGWPGLDLRVPEDEIAQPLTFYHSLGGLAGLEFYSAGVLSDFQDQLLFCRFHSGLIYALTFAPDGSVASEEIVAEGCHTDLITGPEGFIYFLNYVEGSLSRIAAGE